MAEQRNKVSDRRRDVEVLSASIYARLAATAAPRGKTPESVAREALDLARAFYRTLDETPRGD